MRMKTLATLGVVLAAAAIAGCARSDGQNTKAAPPARVNDAPAPQAQTTQGKADGVAAGALRRGSDEKRYEFLLFYSTDDEATRTTKESLGRAVRGMGRSAEWTAVDITNASEAAIVNKYNLRSVPMPIVLAFAPNGAVTGGFRSADIAEDKLKTAFASPGVQECMKALQDRKIVFVCCQGKSTQFNKEAMQGVEAFKADARYAAYTAVVKIDPTDDSERSFLAQLKIDSKTKDAATAILVPPNTVLGVTNGPTTKDAFLRTLASASSCCSSGSKGCAPSGCGPVKK